MSYNIRYFALLVLFLPRRHGETRKFRASPVGIPLGRGYRKCNSFSDYCIDYFIKKIF